MAESTSAYPRQIPASVERSRPQTTHGRGVLERDTDECRGQVIWEDLWHSKAGRKPQPMILSKVKDWKWSKLQMFIEDYQSRWSRGEKAGPQTTHRQDVKKRERMNVAARRSEKTYRTWKLLRISPPMTLINWQINPDWMQFKVLIDAWERLSCSLCS